MPGINRVTLLGNIGQDPEFRVSSNGHGCLKLRVATTESWPDARGERQERTEWHNVVIWGKPAERLSAQLQRGQTVFVDGRLATRKWDKDGKTHYMTEVVATIIVPGERGGERQASPRQELGKSKADPFEEKVEDDDIPF